ncbi:hypothetical protein A2313_01305 [Candidatus Roizmanbacteria bacterium RIFOXYB2_FULL_41_10]|uniref:Uncharacterized protein n=1 Tax=Candidatus Roizmanbacteria bacterium RIFOXYA1_FULL_41_12 TaxID=1802082 RepID=A0A1F7K943_9BACT|nr:MAG: hypothetical protein A2209_02520 [Candidatus Roizmanbacteria bacterium RIFOXYA1_FULL_41_12]OGK67623.1 MAG: hypothetical protein A2377_00620 [Candidatus Roizmanbacteria bacterium RIFOXYB1_FULL_41_27]OGK68493.1 MAG: hypothetical protein A2262_01010 [Candidatus Roizmanbacteria bacterium RIFOXYA2_FULL_41_8]OGK71017.1 MAG: hypothetical protein A2313_01305 [Candidatus Roizmanbacteria bacterium RIFOXYB2_FULL_41_10]OGK71345.1 MAG: hypothetical protein A2403_01005 [Candidatus Roizmanbacteria bac
MKRLFLLFIVALIIGVFFGKVQLVKAQTTCDVCGYCQNSEPPASWETCAQCLYGTNDPNVTLSSDPDSGKAYTVFGCLQIGANCDVATDPDCVAKAGAASFANFFLNFFTTIIGGLAFMAMLFGGAKVMLARGDVDAMREGKRYVYGAILGLIVVVSSVLIVKIIGGSILQIPFLQ